MPFNLPLKEMTLQEKLAAMESLWDDLDRTPEALESPAWARTSLMIASGGSPRDNLDSSIGRQPTPTFVTSSRENRDPG